MIKMDVCYFTSDNKICGGFQKHENITTILINYNENKIEIWKNNRDIGKVPNDIIVLNGVLTFITQEKSDEKND